MIGIMLIAALWVTVVITNIAFHSGNEMINYLSIALWMITCLIFIRRNSEFSAISAQIMLAFTTAGICCTVAESGQFLSEVKYFAHLSGATSRILSLCFFMILSSYITFNALKKIRTVKFGMPEIINIITLKVSVCMFFVFTFILFYIHFKYGHPNDYGVDRYYYWANIAPGWAEYIKFLLSQFTIFIGLAYGLSRKKGFIFLFLASLLAQYSVGDKFSGMLYATMTFLIPIVILLKVNIGRLMLSAKFIIISILFMATMLMVSYLSYVAISGAENGFDRLLDRVVLQGQMWWALDNASDMNMKNMSEISTNLFGINNDNKLSTGIFYLMSIISPPQIFQWFANKGITMTMGSPVNLIYFFGYPFSVIPAICLGVIAGIAFHMLYRSIIIVDIILIFFSIKIIDSLFRVMTMGEIFYLFSVKVGIGLFIFTFYVLASWATLYQKEKAT